MLEAFGGALCCSVLEYSAIPRGTTVGRAVTVPFRAAPSRTAEYSPQSTLGHTLAELPVTCGAPQAAGAEGNVDEAQRHSEVLALAALPHGCAEWLRSESIPSCRFGTGLIVPVDAMHCFGMDAMRRVGLYPIPHAYRQSRDRFV